MVNFFEKISGGNFGDDLNEYLWPKLFGRPLSDIGDDDTYFVGIGTRLRSEVLPSNKRIIVFGAGYGYSHMPVRVDDNFLIKCVRGPLTADALKIDKNLAVTDSAILVRDVLPERKKTHKFGFVPHHKTLSEDNWENICCDLGIKYISPKGNPVNVINSIIECEHVLAESLHAAIISDAYRIPWLPIKTRKRTRIHEFKWCDWGASVGVNISYGYLPEMYNIKINNKSNKGKYLLKLIYSKTLSKARASYELNKLLHNAKWHLSSDDILCDRITKLRDLFSELKGDLGVN